MPQFKYRLDRFMTTFGLPRYSASLHVDLRVTTKRRDEATRELIEESKLFETMFFGKVGT